MEDAMERLGYGRFQQQLLLAAGLCFMADGLEVLLLSFLTVVLSTEEHLTSTQTSLVTACVFAGGLVGAIVLGRGADLGGRRPIFVGTAAMIAFFGLCTGLAPSYPALLVCRFLVGFGVGGST
jgi:putative MFS transporter